METTPVHTLNLTGVLSESKRILKANYWHFVALSLLFLPLSFSIITTPLLHLSTADQIATVNHHHKLPPNLQKPPIAVLLYILTVYLLAVAATATITNSTYNAFLGKPIDFSTALKTLTASFLPLLSTTIVAHILLFCISLSFLLFVGVIVMLAQNLGFVIDYSSIWFSAIVGVTLIGILIYFQVNWSLASAVVVAESKWGMAPLMRSSYLVKGMRSVAVSVLLYFGVFGALMVVVYTNGAVDDRMRGWPFVFITMIASLFLMMFLLRITAANTVLYMYCKALHGELAIEVAGDDYIGLAFDDEKVSHVVTVVTA